VALSSFAGVAPLVLVGIFGDRDQPPLILGLPFLKVSGETYSGE
jgi:hypothetical protein